MTALEGCDTPTALPRGSSLFFSSTSQSPFLFTGRTFKVESAFRENAWNFNQFFKMHFPTGKIKYFIGLGFFIKIPQSTYGITSTHFIAVPERIESFKYEASELPRTWGFNFGGGGELLLQKNYVISFQFGLNLYELDNIRFYQVPGHEWESINSDAHNLYVQLGIGYIFKKKSKKKL